jgi:DNA-binding NarL/FixJ family response regulator
MAPSLRTVAGWRGSFFSGRAGVNALIARGETTKAIARRLGISVKTVEAHRAQLMERPEIRDVVGLIDHEV